MTKAKLNKILDTMTGAMVNGVQMADFRTFEHLHDDKLENLRGDDIVLELYGSEFEGNAEADWEFTLNQLMKGKIVGDDRLETKGFPFTLQGPATADDAVIKFQRHEFLNLLRRHRCYKFLENGF